MTTRTFWTGVRFDLPAPPSCPCGGTHDDEDPGRKFYVSVIDGERYVFLAGPYATHGEALADVDAAQAIAEERDPRAHFYAFGTARAPLGYSNPGLLNEALAAVKRAA